MDILIKGFMMILLFISTVMATAEDDAEKGLNLAMVTVGFIIALTALEIAG